MDFGQRVRTLRKQKGLTREEFCDDERDLSVRQLTRIENGQSTPTLPKITFIAKRLGLTVGEVIGDHAFELPRAYLELKHRLLRLNTYADPIRLAKREAMFKEIYDQFYPQLPEEERLVIDCLRAKSDINLTKETDFGAGLLEDYFGQVKNKPQYSLNDLAFISLYFMCLLVTQCHPKFYDAHLYGRIKQVLLAQVETAPTTSSFSFTALF